MGIFEKPGFLGKNSDPSDGDKKFNPYEYKKIEDMPKEQQKNFKENPDGTFVRKTVTDTPEEAAVEQSYATSLEGVDFSEMVDGKSMEEAEKIVEKLKEAKFDFTSIKWDELNLGVLKHMKNQKERKMVALDLLLSFSENTVVKELYLKLEKERGKKLSKSLKAAILILLLSASLGGFLAGRATQPNTYIEVTSVDPNYGNDEWVEVESEPGYNDDQSVEQEELEKNPDYKSVNVGDDIDDIKEKIKLVDKKRENIKRRLALNEEWEKIDEEQKKIDEARKKNYDERLSASEESEILDEEGKKVGI